MSDDSDDADDFLGPLFEDENKAISHAIDQTDIDDFHSVASRCALQTGEIISFGVFLDHFTRFFENKSSDGERSLLFPSQ